MHHAPIRARGFLGHLRIERHEPLQLQRPSRTLRKPSLCETNQTRYRRFATAAEAVRFVIEELPAAARAGSYLEVDEQRFESGTIQALYDHATYPLERPTNQAPA